MKRFQPEGPCKYGHVAERFVSNGRCVECARVGQRAYRLRNIEAERAKSRAWKAANPSRVSEYRRLHYSANRESRLAQNLAWFKANPEKAAFYTRARDARQLQATPQWADMNAIAAVYAEARRRYTETGVKHHVDHVVPLRGENVCGLHVQTNLAVIPAIENREKWNKWQ